LKEVCKEFISPVPLGGAEREEVASLKEVCKEFISEGDKQDSPGYHPG